MHHVENVPDTFRATSTKSRRLGLDEVFPKESTLQQLLELEQPANISSNCPSPPSLQLASENAALSISCCDAGNCASSIFLLQQIQYLNNNPFMEVEHLKSTITCRLKILNSFALSPPPWTRRRVNANYKTPTIRCILPPPPLPLLLPLQHQSPPKPDGLLNMPSKTFCSA